MNPIIYAWTAKRAGAGITIRGHFDNGLSAKLVDIGEITLQDNAIVAIKKDGAVHRLAAMR